MTGERVLKSRRLKVNLSQHKIKRVKAQKMTLTTPSLQLSETILEISNTCSLQRQRAGHMTMKNKRLLLKNRRNLNSALIDQQGLKIDKILIPKTTLLNLKTSTLISVSLSKRSRRAKKSSNKAVAKMTRMLEMRMATGKKK